MKEDVLHEYYAILSASNLPSEDFHYHQGAKDCLVWGRGKKETIEEIFRSWHRENEQEDGVHLQYELEHGRDGKADQNIASQEGRRGT